MIETGLITSLLNLGDSVTKYLTQRKLLKNPNEYRKAKEAINKLLLIDPMKRDMDKLVKLMAKTRILVDEYTQIMNTLDKT